MKANNEYIVALLLILVSLTGWWVLVPGSYGPFLLDDLLHFPRLSSGVKDFDSFLRWVFGGSSATGRPISYLSFLINDNAWPSDPYLFKLTNILLHCLNGILVYVFARQISKILVDRGCLLIAKKEYFAIAVFAFWMLAPINHSAIFLTIQRMTLLMGTFTLLGLITYLYGRSRIESNTFLSYASMSMGVGFFGALGAFSKDPGVMICLYIVVLELCFFCGDKVKPATVWKWVFLYFPLLAVAGYYVYSTQRMDELYLKRDYGAVERLMTEARVVLDYIHTIFLPRLRDLGPYHDDYVISRGIFSPVSTAISIIIIFSAIIFSVIFRKKYPVVCFGILWFFSGHLLESTIMPLELYFGHRNYIPSLGLIISFVYICFHLPNSLRRVGYFVFFILISINVFVARQSSEVWGNRQEQALIWSTFHPNSMRATLDVVRYWLDQGSPLQAKKHFERAKEVKPNDVGIRLYAFVVDACKPDYGVVMSDPGELEKMIPVANFDHASIESIKFLGKNIKSGRCGISHEAVINLVNLYLANPRYSGNSGAAATLYKLVATQYAAKGELDATIEALDKAFEVQPDYTIALNQAFLLKSAGVDASFVADYVQKAKKSKVNNKFEFLWRKREIDQAERYLQSHRGD